VVEQLTQRDASHVSCSPRFLVTAAGCHCF
jgi:hypothetical protein